MQINQIQPTTFGNRPMLKQMKRNLRIVGAVLSGIGWVAKDIFVHRKKVYVNVGGKMIDERDLPNSVSGPSDVKGGIKWERVKFSPEDEKKMKNMTREERFAYRDKLIDEGKYIIGKYEVWD